MRIKTVKELRDFLALFEDDVQVNLSDPNFPGPLDYSGIEIDQDPFERRPSLVVEIPCVEILND